MPDETANPNPEVPAGGEAPLEEKFAQRLTQAEVPLPPLKLDAYEGPLDLLLDLIRKQQINIYDIPIAKITQQYLAYLRLLKELNIDVAGEFIFMAATLIHIKSRLLLPPDPTAPPEEQEDPRTDLVHRLLEHEQFKSAAQMLQAKRLVEEATWSQTAIAEFNDEADEPGIAVSTFDLIAAFREILERAKKRVPMEIHSEEVTVKQMIEHVKKILLERQGPVPLEDLAVGYVWRQALIALLLALLELVRVRAVLLRQKDLFTPITVARSKRFEEITSQANANLLEAGLDTDWA